MDAAEKDPGSLVAALLRCASLGHRPGTDEFYLTPRGGKVLGIEGYRGIIERMYRSGAVRNVVVREVCANDRFAFIEGVDEKPIHRFGGSNNDQSGAGFFGPKGTLDRGEMVGVYAYAVLDSGAVSRVVILSRDDVMAAKAASDAAKSKYSPWNRLDAGNDHPEFTGRSMWWKTAARRLEPWVPTSAEYRRERMRADAAATAAALPDGQPVTPIPAEDIDGTEGGDDAA
jgi:recombination protein RecT